MPFGKHYLLEQAGDISLLDASELEQVLAEAAAAAGATVLFSRFHDFGEGYGYTGVVALAESHITIHTWPEKRYAAIDIFMCGDSVPEKSVQYLADRFPDDVMEIKKHNRDLPNHSINLKEHV